MNIIAADCGFDPALIERFEDITVEFIRNDNGVDLTGHRNMHISLAAESGDVTINDFECMIPGVDYTIICSNGASTKNRPQPGNPETFESVGKCPVNH